MIYDIRKFKKKKTKADYFVRLLAVQFAAILLVACAVAAVSKISPFAYSGEENVSESENNRGKVILSAADFEVVTAKLTVDSPETLQYGSEDAVAVGVITGTGGEDIGSEQAVEGTTFASYTVSAPVTLPVENARLSSPFGYRTNPVSGNYGFHTGIDLAVPENTPVAAAYGGVVTSSGESDVWGKFVLVEHSEGFETYYCHLNDIYAPEGTVLRSGETLGLVGSTGWSTGPHLHFEVRIDGIRVDPEPLIFGYEN